MILSLLGSLVLLSAPSFAIVNGRVATGSEPFAKSVVALGFVKPDGKSDIFCTGSLLNENTVVTAAHCVFIRDNARPWSLRNGELHVFFGLSQAEMQTRRMVRKKYYETYKPGHTDWQTDLGDIALVQFDGGLPEGYAPLPLLPDNSALVEGAKVILAGFGYSNPSGTRENGGKGTLRHTEAPIKNSRWGETELVTDERSSGTCVVDSGGPGFIEVEGTHYLWGVTIWGEATCVGDAKYTKIPPYADWIREKLAHLEDWTNL